MSRRASNSVRLARVSSYLPLDRNGIPMLDPPREANRLPRRCHVGMHQYLRVGRRFVDFVDGVGDEAIYSIDLRCHCGARTTETEVE